MKNIKLSILLSIAISTSSTANADLSFTVAVGDQIEINTITPGETCTYGGIFISRTPDGESPETSNYCFTGHSRIGYRDSNGIPLPGTFKVGDLFNGIKEALYWSEEDLAWWPINPVTGLVRFTSLDSMYFGTEDCTGDYLLDYTPDNRVRFAYVDFVNWTEQFWVAVESVEPEVCSSNAFGSECTQMICPQGLSTKMIATTNIPDFSIYTFPMFESAF